MHLPGTSIIGKILGYTFHLNTITLPFSRPLLLIWTTLYRGVSLNCQNKSFNREISLA